MDSAPGRSPEIREGRTKKKKRQKVNIETMTVETRRTRGREKESVATYSKLGVALRDG